MRALALEAHGGLDKLTLKTDWPDPAPREGEALIDIKAVSLNYLDIFVRRGMPGVKVEMPRITGADIAGIVLDVGAAGDRSLVGKRVMVDPLIRGGGVLGEHANGGLCERIAVDVGKAILLPDDVSFEAAAALPIAYGTAYRMIATRGRLERGELCMILGASGGVGTGCVQLAKAAGAEVIACASTPDKLEKLRALGADHLIDYSKEDFSRRAWEISGRRGVDLVVNYTGGDSWRPSLRALTKGGRIVCCGATAGFEPQTDLRYIWRREIDVRGSNGWGPGDLERLIELVAEKKLVPVIDRVVPLEGAVEAMRALEAREVFGKVIVQP